LDALNIEIWDAILEIMDDELHLLCIRDFLEVIIMRKAQKVPGIHLYEDHHILLKHGG
jgi:hypothetical protein